MTIDCKSCGWKGPARQVEQHEETDHEVWLVYTCPACTDEIGRTSKYDT